MSKKDYYELLGIDKNSDNKEIKKAYRKMAMKYHPDRNKEPDAESKFKEINEAYEVLSDPQKRSKYDQFGHAAFDNNSFSNQSGFSGFGGFEDIFSDFFSNKNSRSNHNFRQKGQDYQSSIKITFDESIFGKTFDQKLDKVEDCDHCNGTGAENGEKIICSTCNGAGTVNRIVSSFLGKMQQTITCQTCNGEGQIIKNKCSKCNGKKHLINKKETEISIPAGIANGQQIKLSGYGGPGLNGGPNGDLIIKIIVEEHKYFKRKYNDLFLEIPISSLKAFFNDEIKIPTPYGYKKIKIPKNLESGHIEVIKNHGVPYIKSRDKGNLVVNFIIYNPKLSKSELKIISKINKNNIDKKYEELLKKIK